MSWVAAAVGVGTIAYGISKEKEGDEAAKKGRQKLRQSVKRKEEVARAKQKRLEAAALLDMPGTTRREDEIGANTSRRIAATKESSSSEANKQAMIAQAVLGQQDAQADLATEQAEYKDAKRDAAIGGMGDIANIERDKMDMAVGQIAQGEAMKGAGTQNIIGGVTSTAGAAGRIGGGGKGSTTTTPAQKRAMKRKQKRLDSKNGKNGISYKYGDGSEGSFGFQKNRSFGR